MQSFIDPDCTEKYLDYRSKKKRKLCSGSKLQNTFKDSIGAINREMNEIGMLCA